MAKAEKIIPTSSSEVRLTLTQEEALALDAVCWRVGGLPTTRRKHFTEITRALREAGVNNGDPTDISATDRAIYFV